MTPTSCSRCHQPLDQWGEHLTSCRFSRGRDHTPKPIGNDSNRSKVFRAVSVDSTAPSNADTIAKTTGVDLHTVGTLLSVLCTERRLRRVARGLYVRP